MHDKQVRRRRAVLALLVGISLVLLTDYFGESASSPLHNIQRGIVAVLAPVQAGASTVFSPVSDVANWVSTTVNAKSQRDQLERQVHRDNQQLAEYRTQQIQNQQLTREVGLDQTIDAKDWDPVGANVIERDSSLWYQQVEVDKGSNDGVRLNDPVIGDGGLVGKVTLVTGSSSYVTLITNHDYGVVAQVDDPAGNSGVLEPAVGNPDQMLLQQLPGHAAIQPGQLVVTAGYKDPSDPALDSPYPPGILIGKVSSSFSQNELLNDGQVPVTPTASVRNFDSVQILTKPRAGTETAQVGP